MKPADLTIFLQHTIPSGAAVLITGEPGIGKTSIVEQACAAADADLIISHPVVSDQTDVKGLPWPAKDNEHATFLPFGDLARAMKATKRTVWFLDDLGQATASVQASFMQLLLARRVNEHVLPDCITFVAATNRRTDRAGVSGILEPVKSRFVAIVDLTVDIDDWCAWAFTQDIPAELIAFLRFRADLLCSFKPSADLTNSPIPRTWAHVSKLLKLGLPAHVQHSAIIGAVGEGAAVEFTGFLRMFAQLPQIDAILVDPDAAKIPTNPASLYAVATALGMKATSKNFPRIARYAERLMKAQHGEFATLLMRDSIRKEPAITDTQAFVKLTMTPLGDLVLGRV